MNQNERRFREVEGQLDDRLAAAQAALSERGVKVVNRSVRTYDQKESYLLWQHVFSHDWELPLESATVQVWLSYPEPPSSGQPHKLSMVTTAQRFRPGQVSSVFERREREVALDVLLEGGIDALVLKELDFGIQFLSQSPA